MINITDEMRQLIDNAYADGVPCILGTASKDGRPQISMKGSVLVFDRGTLAYWERSMRSALENVAGNPQVVIFYRNPGKRINWRFHGTATVYEKGAIRDNVMNRTIQAELDRDPERKGVAVLIKVDRITELSGNVLQQRD
jgi:predicted pyridoxine 5'-phosphate oxidase superfamily flavin-nucleotide-binding protein